MTTTAVLGHVLRHNSWANRALFEHCATLGPGHDHPRFAWPDDAEERGVVLAQLVHHANEHRTQATTILGANGIEPPAVSGWGYGRAAGISEAEE